MAKVTDRAWKTYKDNLNKLSQRSKDLIVAYMESHEITSQEDKDALIRYAYSVSTKYGEAAAEFACQMYDAEAELEGATLDPAEPAEPASYSDVAKGMYGALKMFAVAEIAGTTIGRMVKQCGQDTTLQNAIRDKAYYAWIPSGDSCPFCMEIAAEGWKRATANALSGGHADHIHGNCDCAYAIKHDKDTEYSSYNPDKYKEMFAEAEGDTKEEKINYIRRKDYEQNKDEINAQKRSNYKELKELESSGTEE